MKTAKLIHRITGTSRHPLLYRTACGKNVTRENGARGSQLPSVTCPACIPPEGDWDR